MTHKLNQKEDYIMKDLIKMIETSNGDIEKLEGKQSISSLTNKLNEIIEKLNNLEVSKRDRGPKSERSMSEEDARRILMGDLKDESHKKCAEILGLSYGQVYSARGGYTFRKIFEESKKES